MTAALHLDHDGDTPSPGRSHAMPSMRRVPSLVSTAATAAMVLGAVSCVGGDRRPAVASGTADAAGTAVTPPRLTTAASDVATAAWPANACGWIPLAEVDSIIGPLAGAPRAVKGDCVYPVPLDAETARRKAAAAKLGQWIRQQGGTPMDDPRPSEPAVVLGVTVENASLMERTAAAVSEIVAGADAGERAAPRDTVTWDWSQRSYAVGVPGFLGRTGQLSVSLMSQAVRLPEDRLAALAARVRDRIPDLPFPARKASSGTASSTDPDPCGLLTRAEVEGVLGKLVVAPYRSIGTSPHPNRAGDSCSYYTRGHRVLVLTPTWSGGKVQLEAARGVGRLTGLVAADRAAESADTLEGPWDDVVANGRASELLFLKGDRLIQIAYGASAADAAGAVRLARLALARL